MVNIGSVIRSHLGKLLVQQLKLVLDFFVSLLGALFPLYLGLRTHVSIKSVPLDLVLFLN
jgi:hypothetical protein